MMTRPPLTTRILRVLATSSVLACAHTPDFRPAPGAALVTGEPRAAQAVAAGVRVVVNEKPWQGEPSNLPDLVTPMQVTLINDSDVPIPIRYRDFSLATENGVRVSALPPLHIQRPGAQIVAVQPLFPSEGFYLFGPYAAFYPGFPLWTGPFDSDLAWYDATYQWQPSLPTPDMLQKALPEGVLQHGGHVSGYLYFNRVQGKGRVAFHARFLESGTGRTLAEVDIPLTFG